MEIADGINRLMKIEYDCGKGIASDEDTALIFRAYIEPATVVGHRLWSRSSLTGSSS